MSDFKRNPKAEAEFPFLKVLGDFIDTMRELSSPLGAATVVSKDAATKPIEDGSGTAGAVRSSGRFH